MQGFDIRVQDWGEGSAHVLNAMEVDATERAGSGNRPAHTHQAACSAARPEPRGDTLQLTDCVEAGVGWQTGERSISSPALEQKPAPAKSTSRPKAQDSATFMKQAL